MPEVTGTTILHLLLALGAVLCLGYAIGRAHQWHRHGRDRDEAYRTGYDQASRAIISVMAERPRPAPLVNPPHVRRTVVNQRQLYPVPEDIQFRTSR